MAGARAATAGRVLAALAGAAAVLVLPRAIGDYRASELAYVAIYLIAILGLNVLTGYTGQISLGHGAFMAIGGYTTAILVADHGVRDLWTIPLAGLAAGVAGLLFGLPALRFTGLHLALATFAAAVAMPAVLTRAEGVTGGGQGINLFGEEGLTGAVAGVTVFGHRLTFNDWLYYLTWTIAGVLFAAAWIMLSGRLGRTFRAIRDSESAAAAAAINPAAYRTLAFGLSAFYAGVAGSLFAIATTFVNPGTFPVALSLALLVGAVVGGVGSLAGALVGAAFVQFLPSGIAALSRIDAMPDALRDAADDPGMPSVVYGAVLIAVMLVLPGGVGAALRRVRPGRA